MASTIDQIPGGTGGSGPTILDIGNAALSAGTQVKLYTAASNCYIHVYTDGEVWFNINNTGASGTGFRVIETTNSDLTSNAIVYTPALIPRVFISGGAARFSSNIGQFNTPFTVLLTEGDYLSAYSDYNRLSVYYMAYI